jgi:hypothetical protein
MRLDDRSGYFVRAIWPDGYQQRITGFTDDAEAREWIANDRRGWLDWMLHRPPLGT